MNIIFKSLILVLLFAISMPASALDKCGVLDFGNDDVWELKSSFFFDIDGQKLSPAVPFRKKIQMQSSSALVTAQKLAGVGIKFTIKPKSGRSLSFQKRGNDNIAAFEGSAENLNVLLINADNGTIYRANIAEALQKKKISFKLDVEAGFYPDDCSYDDNEDFPLE